MIYLLTGSGGYLGRYFVQRMTNDALDFVTLSWRDDTIISSGDIPDGADVVIYHLAAATSDSKKFSAGYSVSVLFSEALETLIAEKMCNVVAFVHACSFGELSSKLTYFPPNLIFYDAFKEYQESTDDYQFWKIVQRNALSDSFSVRCVVIPFISDGDTYCVSSPRFYGVRPWRKILLSSQNDIYNAFKLAANQYSPKVNFPSMHRVKVMHHNFSWLMLLARFVKNLISSGLSGVFYFIQTQSSQSFDNPDKITG